MKTNFGIKRWWRMWKFRRLLSKIDDCCGELDQYVTEHDEWLVVQDLAWAIIEIVGKVNSMKEIFKRVK